MWSCMASLASFWGSVESCERVSKGHHRIAQQNRDRCYTTRYKRLNYNKSIRMSLVCVSWLLEHRYAAPCAFLHAGQLRWSRLEYMVQLWRIKKDRATMSLRAVPLP